MCRSIEESKVFDKIFGVTTNAEYCEKYDDENDDYLGEGIEGLPGLKETFENLSNLADDEWMIVMMDKKDPLIWTSKDAFKSTAFVCIPPGLNFICLTNGIPWQNIRLMYYCNMFTTTTDWTWVNKNGALSAADAEKVEDAILRKHARKEQSERMSDE